VFKYDKDAPAYLRRELAEELGIDAQIGDLITIINSSQYNKPQI
jgi:8-oxo-dGTP pyrophosphatase MutT (NUDIX family)